MNDYSDTLGKIIATRFGIHRGIDSPGVPPNSKEAIRRAIETHPVFVEFDVFYSEADDTIRTGHPPQQPLDELEDILPLFEGSTIYPKIDVKLTQTYDCHDMIDAIIECGSSVDIDFILVNIGGEGGLERMMEAESYFCSKIENGPQFKLNIDLARYRTRYAGDSEDGKLDDIIDSHVSKRANYIYSVSPEIHEEDWSATANFCEKHGIAVICFWLRGWPDNPEPHVYGSTLVAALDIEKEYTGISVYFDINPRDVIDDIGN